MVPRFPCNLDILREDPDYGRLVKRLAAFCRLLLFDPPRIRSERRGRPPRTLPQQQTRIDDIRAVMDAAGYFVRRFRGAALALLFAATHPARTRALILLGAYACFQNGVMEAKAVCSCR
jgi:pimeloyl-ACP methyl ester carboxylesterase